MPFSPASSANSWATSSLSSERSSSSKASFSRPWSARESSSSWETIPAMESTFRRMTSTCCRASGGMSSRASSSSHCISATERGVRSSWATSLVNCFSRRKLASTWSSRLSKVWAKV